MLAPGAAVYDPVRTQVEEQQRLHQRWTHSDNASFSKVESIDDFEHIELKEFINKTANLYKTEAGTTPASVKAAGQYLDDNNMPKAQGNTHSRLLNIIATEGWARDDEYVASIVKSLHARQGSLLAALTQDAAQRLVAKRTGNPNMVHLIHIPWVRKNRVDHLLCYTKTGLSRNNWESKMAILPTPGHGNNCLLYAMQIACPGIVGKQAAQTMRTNIVDFVVANAKQSQDNLDCAWMLAYQHQATLMTDDWCSVIALLYDVVVIVYKVKQGNLPSEWTVHVPPTDNWQRVAAIRATDGHYSCLSISKDVVYGSDGIQNWYRGQDDLKLATEVRVKDLARIKNIPRADADTATTRATIQGRYSRVGKRDRGYTYKKIGLNGGHYVNARGVTVEKHESEVTKLGGKAREFFNANALHKDGQINLACADMPKKLVDSLSDGNVLSTQAFAIVAGEIRFFKHDWRPESHNITLKSLVGLKNAKKPHIAEQRKERQAEKASAQRQTGSDTQATGAAGNKIVYAAKASLIGGNPAAPDAGDKKKKQSTNAQQPTNPAKTSTKATGDSGKTKPEPAKPADSTHAEQTDIVPADKASPGAAAPPQEDDARSVDMNQAMDESVAAIGAAALADLSPSSPSPTPAAEGTDSSGDAAGPQPPTTNAEYGTVHGELSNGNAATSDGNAGSPDSPAPQNNSDPALARMSKTRGKIGGAVCVEIVKGQLQKEKVDAITNPANGNLKHGGGAAAAISQEGGPAIQQESDLITAKMGAIPTGSCVVTGAGTLPAKWVIHTVGPVWNNTLSKKVNAGKLYEAVAETFKTAEQKQYTSISLPAISSGIFGFPKELCAEICFQALRDFVKIQEQSGVRNVKEVRFTNFDDLTVKIFQTEFDRLFGGDGKPAKPDKPSATKPVKTDQDAPAEAGNGKPAPASGPSPSPPSPSDGSASDVEDITSSDDGQDFSSVRAGLRDAFAALEAQLSRNQKKNAQSEAHVEAIDLLAQYLVDPTENDKDPAELFGMIAATGINVLDLYYAAHQYVPVLNAKGNLRRGKRTIVNNGDHTEVAEMRRSNVVEAHILALAYDNIVFIGGHIKREMPVIGKNNVYINPTFTAADNENNRLINEYIAENPTVKVQLINAKIQSVTKDMFDEDIDVGKTLFVSINSCYYFGSEIMQFAKCNDAIYVVGHVGYNGATSAENDYAAGGYGERIEFTDQYIDMPVKGTTDHFLHKSVSMLSMEAFTLDSNLYTNKPEADIKVAAHGAYYDCGVGGQHCARCVSCTHNGCCFPCRMAGPCINICNCTNHEESTPACCTTYSRPQRYGGVYANQGLDFAEPEVPVEDRLVAVRKFQRLNIDQRGLETILFRVENSKYPEQRRNDTKVGNQATHKTVDAKENKVAAKLCHNVFMQTHAVRNSEESTQFVQLSVPQVHAALNGKFFNSTLSQMDQLSIGESAPDWVVPHLRNSYRLRHDVAVVYHTEPRKQQPRIELWHQEGKLSSGAQGALYLTLKFGVKSFFRGRLEVHPRVAAPRNTQDQLQYCKLVEAVKWCSTVAEVDAQIDFYDPTEQFVKRDQPRRPTQHHRHVFRIIQAKKAEQIHAANKHLRETQLRRNEDAKRFNALKIDYHSVLAPIVKIQQEQQRMQIGDDAKQLAQLKTHLNPGPVNWIKTAWNSLFGDKPKWRKANQCDEEPAGPAGWNAKPGNGQPADWETNPMAGPPDLFDSDVLSNAAESPRSDHRLRVGSEDSQIPFVWTTEQDLVLATKARNMKNAAARATRAADFDGGSDSGSHCFSDLDMLGRHSDQSLPVDEQREMALDFQHHIQQQALDTKYVTVLADPFPQYPDKPGRPVLLTDYTPPVRKLESPVTQNARTNTTNAGSATTDAEAARPVALPVASPFVGPTALNRSICTSDSEVAEPTTVPAALLPILMADGARSNSGQAAAATNAQAPGSLLLLDPETRGLSGQDRDPEAQPLRGGMQIPIVYMAINALRRDCSPNESLELYSRRHALDIRVYYQGCLEFFYLDLFADGCIVVDVDEKQARHEVYDTNGLPLDLVETRLRKWQKDTVTNLYELVQGQKYAKMYVAQLFGGYNHVSGNYRHGYRPPTFQWTPTSKVLRFEGRRVMATTDFNAALGWIIIQAKCNKKVLGYDLEARSQAHDLWITSLQLANDKEALVFYGPDVRKYLYVMMYFLQLHNFQLLCWDATMDGISCNTRDLQADSRIVSTCSAQAGLETVAMRFLSRGKCGQFGDYANPGLVTDKDIHYAVNDAILCYDIERFLVENAAKIPTDKTVMQIGNVTLTRHEPNGEETKEPPVRTWCTYDYNQACTHAHAAKIASQWYDPSGKTKLTPIDAGEGTGSMCVAAVVHAWHQLQEMNAGSRTNILGCSDPIWELAEEGFARTDLLVPGQAGVTPQIAREFCAANNIELAVFTTSTTDAFSKRNPPRNNASRVLVLLAHHDHAYLLIEEAEKEEHLADHSPVIYDCHCGQCIVAPKRVPNPTKPGQKMSHVEAQRLEHCEDCFMLGVKVTTLRESRSEVMQKELSKALKDKWHNTATSYNLQGVRFKCQDTYTALEEKAWQDYHTAAYSKPRESVLKHVDDVKGWVLTSRCVGTVTSLRPTTDQILQRFRYDGCHELQSAFTQIGFVFRGRYQETWCNCSKTLAYALVQRTAKSKGVCGQLKDEYIDKMVTMVENTYHRVDFEMSYENVMGSALRMLLDSDKPAQAKVRIGAELDALHDQQNDVYTHTTAFVKKEMTFNAGWPRAISARHPVPRTISAVPYETVQEQVYENEHMIKKLNDGNMIPTIIRRIAPFEHVDCLDIGSYDAAQRGKLWKVEFALFKTIVGEDAAKFWQAIALNKNVIKSKNGVELHTITTRNSGEQTTSLTNTLLNYLLIMLHAQLNKQRVGQDFDFFVEGDDMIIGFNNKAVWSQLKHTYNMVGFQTTVDHSGTFEGASFCKIIFMQDKTGAYQGFRRVDHTLLKLGWTRKSVRKRDSQTARNLMHAKALSCKSMFHSSVHMCSLMDTIIAKLGFVRATKDNETHLQPAMTSTTLVDAIYGADLIKLREVIEEKGLYVLLNADDYASLFPIRQATVKRIDYQFKDFDQARTLIERGLKGNRTSKQRLLKWQANLVALQLLEAGVESNPGPESPDSEEPEPDLPRQLRRRSPAGSNTKSRDQAIPAGLTALNMFTNLHQTTRDLDSESTAALDPRLHHASPPRAMTVGADQLVIADGFRALSSLLARYTMKDALVHRFSDQTVAITDIHQHVTLVLQARPIKLGEVKRHLSAHLVRAFHISQDWLDGGHHVDLAAAQPRFAKLARTALAQRNSEPRHIALAMQVARQTMFEEFSQSQKHRTVKVGHTRYVVERTPETDLCESEENFCPANTPQTLSFNELQDRMRSRLPHLADCQIIDTGSSTNLLEYTSDGSSCTAQALAWSAASVLRLTEDETETVQQLTEHVLARLDINVQSLAMRTREHGISVTDIIAQCRSTKTNIHVWTPENLSLRVFNGRPIEKGDVHIVVFRNHAYAFAAPNSNTDSRPRPVDCVHQCWRRMRSTRAFSVMTHGVQMDPRQHAIMVIPGRGGAADFLVVGREHGQVHDDQSPGHHQQGRGAQIQNQERTKPPQMDEPTTYKTSDFIAAVENYYRDGQESPPIIVMKEVGTVGQDPPASMIVPVVIWKNDKEQEYLRTHLKELASHGVVIAVDGATYRQLKRSNPQGAKAYMRPFTAHNDKLGFDFRLDGEGKGRYTASLGKQFKGSAYPKFLEAAAKKQRSWDNDKYADYLALASQQFNMDPVPRTFEVPTDSTKQRSIEGLRKQIAQLTERTNQQARKLKDAEAVARIATNDLANAQDDSQHMQRLVQGYETKIIIQPGAMIDYPKKLRENLHKVVNSLESTEEVKYIQALVDPFHPQSEGARVPVLLPRPTVAYNDFVNIELPQNDLLIITNYEQPHVNHTVIIDVTAAPGLLTNTPTKLQGRVDAGGQGANAAGQLYDVYAIDTGLDFTQFKAAFQLITDPTIEPLFTKQRIVSSGTRFFKTSSADNEAGQIDMNYSRDGAMIDETSAINSLFQRPTEQSKRVYLAGAGHEVRGNNGFLIQSNFRPFDEQSFVMRDNLYDQKEALFGDQLAVVWVCSALSNTLYPIQDAPDLGDECFLVVESLQQRHTMLTKISNRSLDMKVSMERSILYEGIPDQSAYGFIQRSQSQLVSASSPLQLIQQVPTQNIFADYSRKRQVLLQELFDGEAVDGLWKDTLFPAIKDLAHYGADKLGQGDRLKHIVDAAVDTALGTLSTMIPELAPAAVAAKLALRKPVERAAEKARAAVDKWAVSGHHGSQFTAHDTSSLSHMTSFCDDASVSEYDLEASMYLRGRKNTRSAQDWANHVNNAAPSQEPTHESSDRKPSDDKQEEPRSHHSSGQRRFPNVAVTPTTPLQSVHYLDILHPGSAVEDEELGELSDDAA